MRMLRILPLTGILAVLAASAVFAQQPYVPPSAPPTPAGATSITYPRPPGEIVQQLVQKYVKTDSKEEKKGIRDQLAEVLGHQFDDHIQQERKELEDLEKQLASLRALLRKRQDAQGTIIERRIDQLVQEAEGLGW